MKAFCFVLTLLCIVQSILAIPRPEFAISPTVTGSAKVRQATTDLVGDINTLRPVASSINLTSGYTLLTSISGALQAIVNSIITTGLELTTQLTTLSNDNAGPIEGSYTNIVTKITNFKNLLTGNFNGSMTTITNGVGADMPKQLRDLIGETTKRLDTLRTAIDTLKSDALAYRSSKKAIPAKSVSDVSTVLVAMRSGIKSLKLYTAAMLERIHVADLFLIDMQASLVKGTSDYSVSYQAFQVNLAQEDTTIEGQVTTAVGSSPRAVISDIQAGLTNDTTYASAVDGAITRLNAAFTTDITTTNTNINGSFTSYSNDVPSLRTNLTSDLGTILCAALKQVLYIYIANGKYADVCFYEYSQKVYIQTELTIYNLDTCFEQELVRIINLETVVKKIAKLMTFITDDLHHNLSFCLDLPAASKASCFTAIGPYYGNLATQAKNHATSIGDVVDYETTASYNRLGACITNVILGINPTARAILTDATACMGTGTIA